MARDYTIGRGEVHFARFLPGTTKRTGFRYLGNTPEFSLTLESETLDHYSSDRGIREKDASVTIEVSRSGTIAMDEINNENVSMFLFSQAGAEVVSVAGGAVTGYAIEDVIPGQSYPLGVSDADPVGALSIAYPGTGPTAFAVKKGSTVLSAGEDYIYTPASALLQFIDGGAVVKGDDVTVDYTELAYSFEQVKSGSEPVTGALMFVTYNPIGPQRKFIMPYVSISPNGDWNLKGDEWQQLPLNFEILRLNTLEAVYVNGSPFTP